MTNLKEEANQTKIKETKPKFEETNYWLNRTRHYCWKLGLFIEEEFFSEPRPRMISSPKSKLGINFKAFGWTDLQKRKTLICYWTNTAGFQLQIYIRHLDLVRSKYFVFPFEVLNLICLIIPSLIKSLRELITSKLGSIGSPWSWKKMSWTPISMRRFQFQREMRLRPCIRRSWLWKRESLLILSRITSYHKCPPSRHLKLCLMP